MSHVQSGDSMQSQSLMHRFKRQKVTGLQSSYIISRINAKLSRRMGILLTFIMIICVCVFFTIVFIYREYFKSKFEKLV